MALQLKTDEVLPFRLGQPIDSNGDPAQIEPGSLTFESSAPDVFTIEKDPDFPDDEFAGIIVSQGVGAGVFKATADADLGDGVTQISLEVAGEVIALDATGFAPFVFGEPRKKTPPAEEENDGIIP